jgi:hypothetical protein
MPEIDTCRANCIELTPEPHFESRACLFVGELHDLLAQQRITDRHRQVIERTEAGKDRSSIGLSVTSTHSPLV